MVDFFLERKRVVHEISQHLSFSALGIIWGENIHYFDC